MSRRAQVAPAVVFLALAMACGPDAAQRQNTEAAVAAGVWAEDVCGTMRPWASKIQMAVSTTQATLATSSEPTAVKPQLTQLFSSAAAATDKAIADFDDAGVPDVDNGVQIAKDLRRALVSARNAFAAAQGAVQALDTSDKAKFDAAVARVGMQLKADTAMAGNNIRRATSEELTKAFDRQPACV